MREVIAPTLAGLAAEGMPYTGFLYAGIMIAPDGTPNVLEFNCRFGDPETQPVLSRLRSDLVTLCRGGARGPARCRCRRTGIRARRSASCSRPAVTRTIRARAIRSPGSTKPRSCPARSFMRRHAQHAGRVVTAGGRVLCAVGLGEGVAEAQRAAYALVDRIRWDGMQFRRDIGWRAL